jgi:hypothetical protein
MPYKRKQRVFAVVALVAVLCFTYASVNHWDSTPRAAEHCQVCHVAHSLSVGISAAALIFAPAVVNRLALSSRMDPAVDPLGPHVSSRAPPLAFQLS